jgi:hypothetical protein
MLRFRHAAVCHTFDHTHTNPAGAEMNAAPLIQFLAPPKAPTYP